MGPRIPKVGEVRFDAVNPVIKHSPSLGSFTNLVPALVAALVLFANLPARAQLVADGDTAIIDGISTNLWDSDLTVGSNGPNTLLILTNSGTVSDTNGYIGYSAGANSNQVTVTGPGSLWTNSGRLTVGNSGSSNTLLLSKGGQAASTRGWVGPGQGANNNQVTVTDMGSLWTTSGRLEIGSMGSSNTMLIANGGQVASTDFGVGGYVGAKNNQVTVTDTGSLWTNSGMLYIGVWGSSNNLLLITNGGQVTSTNGVIGDSDAFPSRSDNNQVVVTGPNSRWNNSGALDVGILSSWNRLLVTNGGRVANTSCYIGRETRSTNNQVIVTGPNSLWVNSGTLYLGNGGSSVMSNLLLITDGGQVAGTDGYVGYSSSRYNQAMVVGPNSLWTNSGSLSIGYNSTFNSLLITNGGQVANTSGYIGYGPGATNNQVIVTGPNSLWTNSGTLYIGNNGSSNNLLLIINGGQVASTEGYVERVIVAGPNSRWTMSGALWVGSSLLITDGGLVTNGSVGIGGSIQVSGPGSMLKSSGPLTIYSSSSLLITNGGAVEAANATVSSSGSGIGLCLANGTLSVPGRVTVNSGGFLTGSGIISGVVSNTSNGTVSPGAPIGRLILSNSPVLQGKVLMDISRSGLTLTNDQIQVTGPLKYGGPLLTVSNLGPSALLLGDSFKLFDTSS